MVYNPSAFFDQMLGYLNAMENTKLPKEDRIRAVLDAYVILQDADRNWPDICEKDRTRARYYWDRIVQPSARRLGLILDGGEPKYRKSTIEEITPSTDLGSITY